ncbi:sigma-54 interaction domain-containing protein [Peptoniphilaceae bacterium SGI.137]|nr:sigma 54-interacting transcriptional regulator [Peptoniphilaceae bacterium]MDY3986473.1 sigma 54-interacting transcriptional regulator [Peptoniphilaceae bacterium]MDY5842106.1 sigma 54-interacting transcriptional regulator [Peptoniphilaceae bacterium]MDY6146985.1 sigma 54-interacting transcriptional regulator [Peptoniphilaceae bacterium]
MHDIDPKIPCSLLNGDVKSTNNQLNAIFNSLNDGLYITDEKANTILINTAYQKISGLSPDQVMGKNMRELVKERLINRSGSLYVLEKKKPISLHQTFSTGKHAIISSKPIFDHSGQNLQMIVTVVRDMTELVTLKKQFDTEISKNEALRKYMQRNESGSQILAKDPKTVLTLKRSLKVAPLDSTVLLTGETGVGKELFAQYIYENSRRKNESYIAINCGAVSPELIESEFFGYEGGSFTGAKRGGAIGIFESANGGTVFLDEIGELPMPMQVHLLRVLQEMQIRRVGGTDNIDIDVRVIAATNRDLKHMVEEGKFREDLYFRLNVVPIEIPPLRERIEDIAPLAKLFLKKINKKYQFNRTFSDSAFAAMEGYDWPGNVRELNNIVEQSAILCDQDEIMDYDLPICTGKYPTRQINCNGTLDLRQELEKIEAEYILQAYERMKSVRAAAGILGISASTFSRKLNYYQGRFKNETPSQN